MIDLNRHTLILTLLASILISCGSNSREERSEYTLDVTDEFQQYHIQADARAVRLPDLVEHMTIIKLEETDESLLNRTSNLFVNEEVMITSDPRNGDFYIFDRSGNFKTHFNHIGNGPEQYARAWGFWVEGELIRINDPANSAVIDFDMDGNFVGRIELPYSPNHIIGDGESIWLEVSTTYVRDSVMAQLSKYNPKQGTDSLFLLQKLRGRFDMPSTMNSFSYYEGNILYKRFLSDSTYMIKDGSVYPFALIEFDEGFLWNDAEALDYEYQQGYDAMNTSGKVWQVWPFYGRDWVYMRYHTTMTDAKYQFINRRTGEQFHLKDIIVGEETIHLNARLSYENQMVMAVSSDHITELLEYFDASQYSFAEGSSLEEIESSENPVILFMKFR